MLDLLWIDCSQKADAFGSQTRPQSRFESLVMLKNVIKLFLLQSVLPMILNRLKKRNITGNFFLSVPWMELRNFGVQLWLLLWREIEIPVDFPIQKPIGIVCMSKKGYCKLVRKKSNDKNTEAWPAVFFFGDKTWISKRSRERWD